MNAPNLAVDTVSWGGNGLWLTVVQVSVVISRMSLGPLLRAWQTAEMVVSQKLPVPPVLCLQRQTFRRRKPFAHL